MISAVWVGNGKIVLEERGKPVPNENEVLVKVHRAGICATDVHIVQDKLHLGNPPLVLGHEFAGEIVELGKSVKGITLGQRICVDAEIGCGTCYHCQKQMFHLCPQIKEFGINIDGGWQEYISIPARNAYLLPDTVSYEEAALLEPLNCTLGAVERLHIHYGDEVLIFGSGPAGLMYVQLAKLKGAGKIILVGIQAERQQLGQELGADVLLNGRDPKLQEKIVQIT